MRTHLNTPHTRTNLLISFLRSPSIIPRKLLVIRLQFPLQLSLLLQKSAVPPVHIVRDQRAREEIRVRARGEWGVERVLLVSIGPAARGEGLCGEGRVGEDEIE